MRSDSGATRGPCAHTGQVESTLAEGIAGVSVNDSHDLAFASRPFESQLHLNSKAHSPKGHIRVGNKLEGAMKISLLAMFISVNLIEFTLQTILHLHMS